MVIVVRKRRGYSRETNRPPNLDCWGRGGNGSCLDEGLEKEYAKPREEHVQRPWDRQELGLLEKLEDDHIVGCGDQWAKWYEGRLKRGQEETVQGFHMA